MAISSPCPAEQALQDFMAGKVDEPALSDLSRHLEACRDCQARADTMASHDTFSEPLRADPAAARKIAEEVPPPLVEKVKELARDKLRANTVDLSPPADDREQAPGLDFLAPPQQPDELGRLDSYRVLAALGKGGMGMVFLAEDWRLERRVALKVMLPRFAANEAARRRFLREARLAANLKSDHIVHIYQVGEERGVPFLAMELLEGAPLDKVLEGGRSPSLPHILRIARETALGLAAAHDKGLIHRDIKPGNLWLERAPGAAASDAGRVKILDFGLARPEKDDIHITSSGAVVGTPAFMAPEQARGDKNVDARADLFSLGCVLYRLCVGDIPFKAETTMGVLMALATEQPTAPRALNDQIPEALSTLILDLLSKDPAKRPASARAVIERLTAIENESATKAASVPLPGAALKAGSAGQETHELSTASIVAGAPPRKRRRLALTVALLFLAGAAAAAVFFWQTPDGKVVRIECDDPAIQIAFGDGELKVAGAYKEPLSLKPGKNGLRIKKGDFEFETDKLIVSRGDRIVLRIDVLDGKVQIVREGKGVLDTKELPAPLARKDATKDGALTSEQRKALEWLLGNGGVVTGMKTAADIPDGPVSELFAIQLVGPAFTDESVQRLRVLPPVDSSVQFIRCSIGDAGARALLSGVLKRTRHLVFQETPVTDALLEDLKRLPRLEALKLNGTKVTEKGIALLAGLRLQELEVTNLNVTPEAARGLARMESLRSIWLGNCSLDDEGAKALAALTGLESVVLRGNSLTDQGVIALAALPRLSKLDVVTNAGVTDASLDAISKCRSLRHLDVGGNKLTRAAVDKLALALPQCRIIGVGKIVEPRGLPAPILPGAPLSPEALVSRPAPLAGLASWTMETIGHRGPVYALAFHKDGRLLAALGDDNTVRIWDTATGLLDRAFVGLSFRQAWSNLPTVAWSPDGTRLAAVTADGSAAMWEYPAGKQLLSLGGAEWVNSISWSPEGKLLAIGFRKRAADRWSGAEIWEAETGRTVRPLDKWQVHHWVRWSPDGKWAFGRAGNSSGLLVPLDPGRPEIDLGAVDVGDFSTEGKWLVFGFYDREKNLFRLNRWNLATGKLDRVLAPNVGVVPIIAWSPAGSTVFYVRDSGVPTLLDSETGKDTLSFAGDVRGVAWSPNGKMLAVGGMGTIRLVSALNGVTTHTIEGNVGLAPLGLGVPGRGNLAALSPDRSLLAQALGVGTSNESRLQVWDTATHRPIRAAKTRDHVFSLAWRPDGGRVAVASAGPVLLVDPRSDPLLPLEGFAPQYVQSLAWSPDGSRLVGGQTTEASIVFAGDKRAPVKLKQGGGSGITALAWSPDGKWLATCAYVHSLKIWEAENGRLARELPADNPPALMSKLAWSHDGSLLAAVVTFGPANCPVIACDANTGKEVGRLPGVASDVTWLKDGTLLVDGADHRARLWDPKANKVLREIVGPGPGQFTADGAGLAERLTAGARVWDITTGRPGHTYLMLRNDAYLALTPDGHFHGSKGVEEELVYVTQKEDGSQETLSPAEFARRYGWSNDPSRVTKKTGAAPSP